MMEQAERKRPIGVWVIAILYILGSIGGFLSFYFVSTGAWGIPAEQQAYFDNLSVLDFVLGGLAGLVGLAAAIALFLLRKSAFYMFVAVLVLEIIQVIWDTLDNRLTAEIGGEWFIGGIIIEWAVLVAICLYVRYLIKRSVLV